MMAVRLSAGDICTRSITFAYGYMAVDAAARMMREQHVGSLVVVDDRPEGRVVVGMLTDRDIVTAIVAKVVDPSLVTVGEVMSADVVSVRDDDSIIDVLSTMRRKGVRRVPVVDARGALIGLVALDDLLEIVAQELDLAVNAMRNGRRHESVARP
jgi:CBS domain-containing protein